MVRFLLLLHTVLVTMLAASGQSQAPPLLHPDARYKADLLMVVAHPDDDMVAGGYLARLSLDERKRVAVVYCTNGDGGGNSVGYEAGAALGQMRMIEARRALSAYGIDNVWFLNGHDTPGQNVLWSLDSWNHGRALNDVVRLVRLTRPEVILTWLPNYVVGENHDDHQAAGVLATEAFDMAGDPTQYSEQVSPPRDRTGMMNLTEGLQTWQPQKLYYMTDAFEDFGPYWHDAGQFSPFRKRMMDGRGPSYATTTISSSRRVSYARLTVDQQLFYRTQEADIAERALKSQKFQDFEYPVRLIFGKSVVGGAVTGDVFENVSKSPVPFARTRGHEPSRSSGLSFEIGDPWRFYSIFWKAHNLENLADLIPVPEAAVKFGTTLNVSLLACNRSAAASEIAIAPTLPEGWTDRTHFMRYPVQPGECYPIQQLISAPPSGHAQWLQVQWSATAAGELVGSVSLRVYVGDDGGLPQ